jgi:hypothetical protein
MYNFLPLVEENIWAGEGANKRRLEKFRNEEIFCTPPEILVVC